ncbi:hypothetical protein [Pseudochryseolinea flava]|uniref:Outer membrane protein beta-barrel domain-containing protein n=1 Tax=Pseudochryseolinea flava TaxID=2059302 RepID=A0A364XVY2_9BACT|nr:hypothetical protein [Pseudochryseolinea flava]RAV98522.1 hypothetical protein DQQ10_23675 [Pseudochryseolinea flava]
MMRSSILALLLLVGMVQSTKGQMSIGGTLDFFWRDISKEQPFNHYVNIGVIFKKNLTPTLNLVSGATLRFFDSNVRDLSVNTDLVTYWRDAYDGEFFYITDRETFRFSYVNIPIGLEYKITTWLRASYSLENNFLIRASGEVEQYMQFGKKALNTYMISHNARLLLHARNGLGIAVGCVFNPGIIRKDLPYSYEFMTDYQQRLRSSYCLTASFWGDVRFKKRKHAL